MSGYLTPAGWLSGKLEDLVFFQRGFDITQDQQLPGDVPVISSSGVTSYHNEARACGPGVVIGRKGTLGSVHFSETDYWPHDTTLWSKDLRGNDPRYVYYYMQTVDVRRLDVGNSNPTLNRNHIHGLPVSIPPVETQRRISRLLSAYDGLIDNNRRRIKLLEDSVRLLFDEWFVRRQLPQHLDSMPDEEPLHLSVFDLCIETKAQVLPEAIDADTPYIGLEHMPRRAITLSDWGVANDVTSAKLRYVEGDIIFGKIRPYFHKVGIALTDGVCSSDSIVMRPRAQTWRPLLLALVSSDAFISATAQGMKEGSKMPRADWKQMRTYSVCVPNQRVLSAFNGVIEPVLQQVKTLALQSRKLRIASDLLLPRLMSGELTV